MKPTKDTPPAFLASGFGDRQNISEGLPNLYLGLRGIVWVNPRI